MMIVLACLHSTFTPRSLPHACSNFLLPDIRKRLRVLDSYMDLSAVNGYTHTSINVLNHEKIILLFGSDCFAGIHT